MTFAEQVETISDSRLERYKKNNCTQTGVKLYLQRLNNNNTVDMLAVICKEWSCPNCAMNILRPRLIKNIQAAIDSSSLDQMLTLTLRKTNSGTPKARSNYMQMQWRAFKRAYQRKFKSQLSYIWFREMEDDWPHLHVLTKDCDKRWAKETWHHYTGAYEVEVTPITDPLQKAEYVTKAIFKNACRYGKTTGRWWGKSSDVVMPKDEPTKKEAGKGEWQPMESPLTRELCDRLGASIVYTDQAARPTYAIAELEKYKIARSAMARVVVANPPCRPEPSEGRHPRGVGTPARADVRKEETA